MFFVGVEEFLDLYYSQGYNVKRNRLTLGMEVVCTQRALHHIFFFRKNLFVAAAEQRFEVLIVDIALVHRFLVLAPAALALCGEQARGTVALEVVPRPHLENLVILVALQRAVRAETSLHPAGQAVVHVLVHGPFRPPAALFPHFSNSSYPAARRSK